MSDKNPSQVQPQLLSTGYFSMYPSPKSNEMDLFELTIHLWKKKFWIIGCMLLTTFLAGGYVHFAKEQWTSVAIIDVPTYNTMNNYYQGVRLIEGPTDRPSSSDVVAEKLFKQFINQASSYDELYKFVSQSDYFHTLINGKSTNKIASELNELIDDIKIVKNADNSTYNVFFPANSAKSSKDLLESYLNLVNNNVNKNQYAELTSQIINKKENIKDQMSAFVKIAEAQRQEEIKNLKTALSIAEKANIQKPELNGLTNLDSSNLFLLGKDALTAMADGIEKRPLTLSGDYYNLQRQYISLDNFKVNSSSAQSFSYLKSPIEPIKKDKPKSVLLVFLGMMIGFIIGSGGVLGHLIISNYNDQRKNV